MKVNKTVSIVASILVLIIFGILAWEAFSFKDRTVNYNTFKNSYIEFTYISDWDIKEDSLDGSTPALLLASLGSPNRNSRVSNGQLDIGCTIQVSVIKQTDDSPSIAELVSKPLPDMKNVGQITVANKPAVRYDTNIDGGDKEIIRFFSSGERTYSLMKASGISNNVKDSTKCDEEFTRFAQSIIIP